MKSAVDLLEEIRNNNAGIDPKKAVRILEGFGFVDSGGTKHGKYKHSGSKQMMTLPRHNELGSAYGRQIVQKVDAVLAWQAAQEDQA